MNTNNNPKTVINPDMIPHNFICTLRRNGIKVRVKHYRWVVERSDDHGEYFLGHVTKENRKEFHIETRGGRTDVMVTMKNGKSHTGSSHCHFNDAYNKRLGAYVAATRALQDAKKYQEYMANVHCKVLVTDIAPN